MTTELNILVYVPMQGRKLNVHYPKRTILMVKHSGGCIMLRQSFFFSINRAVSQSFWGDR